METNKSVITCSVSDCDRPVHLKGMCIMHYARVRRTGNTDDPRLNGWGQKKSHPYWVRWRKLFNREVLCEDWKDFWKFVKDIGIPTNAKNLRRLDETKPYGPDNFEWAKTPTKEDEVEYQKKYRQENANEIRNTVFKRKYGITLEEYNKLFSDQNGVCAICKQPERIRRRSTKGDIQMMSIDHCHKTGKVRGLLCGDCNRALGCLKDNVQTVQNAIDYLIKYAP